MNDMKLTILAVVMLTATVAQARPTPKPTPVPVAPLVVEDANNVNIGPYMRDAVTETTTNGLHNVSVVTDDVILNVNGRFFAIPWAGGGLIVDPETGFSAGDISLYFTAGDCSGPMMMAASNNNASVTQVIGNASINLGRLYYPDPASTPSVITYNSFEDLNPSTPGFTCFVGTGTVTAVDGLTQSLPTTFVPPFHVSVMK